MGSPQARTPRDRESTLIKAVAIGGGVITLAGVAFLVAVAIQAGLLGPAGRVILAYIVSAALLAAAHHFRAKAPAASVTALLATGLYTALATTWLMALELEWIPAWIAPPIMAVIYLAVGAYAVRVNQRAATGTWLAGGAAVGAVTFSAFNIYYAGSTLVFLIPLIIVGMGIAHKNYGISAIGALSSILVYLSVGRPDVWISLDVVTVEAIVTAVILAVLGLKFRISSPYPDFKIHWGVYPAILVVGAAIVANSMWTVWLVAVVTAGLLVLALRAPFGSAATETKMTPAADLCAWMLRALPIVLVATTEISDMGLAPSVSRSLGLVGFAAFCLAAVLVVNYIRDNLTIAIWAFCALWLTWELAERVLGFWSRPISTELFIQAALLAVTLVVLTVLPQRLPRVEDGGVKVVALLLALYLSMLAVVGIALQLGVVTGGTEAAFRLGHAVVSIGWMVLAAWFLLAKHLGLTGLGAALAIGSVVKLVFYDMAAINGLIRALAFLLCGIVLLTIAVKRSSPEEASAISGD
ncbi:hypothetical protein HMPREF2559_10740 [Corynebacterium sp. HMSC072G08]|uniref:DUF2339 domain-containing protein n=1 Tax=Corynebacterium sp. HMSC072G08 TaxID=1715039 RepID=UPI0008A3C8D9|nr:DUF2339 domain-containing protein [Corynebacterium sp. HMSC072G08]OFN43218.1 hypothetical protein HMPREF2559_10740 [Corynebacterium sp. HMSC072G08]